MPLHEETPQRCHPRPARHGVIGDIEEPAGFESPADQGNDRLPVLGTDPAVDAMQTYDVELRQGCVLQQLVETGFAELDILEASCVREATGSRKVSGVE